MEYLNDYRHMTGIIEIVDELWQMFSFKVQRTELFRKLSNQMLVAVAQRKDLLQAKTAFDEILDESRLKAKRYLFQPHRRVLLLQSCLASGMPQLGVSTTPATEHFLSTGLESYRKVGLILGNVL